MENDELLVALAWYGAEDDAGVSIMWGDDGDDTVRRGSCFAACHSDMPGMSRDRGQQIEKYLWASRSQQRSIGKPAITRDASELAALVEQGVFAELWSIGLGKESSAMSATVLAGVDWHSDDRISATTNYENGRWQVMVRRKLTGAAGSKTFDAEGKYTLGVALNGARNPGGKHWVSLPLTFSLSGDETDFKVR